MRLCSTHTRNEFVFISVQHSILHKLFVLLLRSIFLRVPVSAWTMPNYRGWRKKRAHTMEQRDALFCVRERCAWMLALLSLLYIKVTFGFYCNFLSHIRARDDVNDKRALQHTYTRTPLNRYRVGDLGTDDDDIRTRQIHAIRHKSRIQLEWSGTNERATHTSSQTSIEQWRKMEKKEEEEAKAKKRKTKKRTRCRRTIYRIKIIRM